MDSALRCRLLRRRNLHDFVGGERPTLRYLGANSSNLLGCNRRSLVAPVVTDVGNDICYFLVIEDSAPGHHRTTRIEWLAADDQIRSLKTIEHNSNDSTRIFLSHDVGTGERRKCTRLAQAVRLVARGASGAIINCEACVKWIRPATDLKCLHLIHAYIRRVYPGFKPPAMLIEIDCAPIQQQKQHDNQPHRYGRAVRSRCLSGSVGGRLIRRGTHFAGLLVAGAFVAAGLGAGGGVSGASYSGVSARRLNK